MQTLSRWTLQTLGWSLRQEDAGTERYVLIVAPHTSNWDFPLGLLVAWALDLRANWIGKHTLFRWPLGPLFRSWGGIPVTRDDASKMISQMAHRFATADRLVLAMAPEGTRAHTAHWKSGFWHIARAAKVPIVMASLDYGRKEVVLGGAFLPGEDREADFETIRAFFADKQGKRPQQAGVIKGRTA